MMEEPGRTRPFGAGRCPRYPAVLERVLFTAAHWSPGARPGRGSADDESAAYWVARRSFSGEIDRQRPYSLMDGRQTATRRRARPPDRRLSGKRRLPIIRDAKQDLCVVFGQKLCTNLSTSHNATVSSSGGSRTW